jgi:hypothetical protein
MSNHGGITGEKVASSRSTHKYFNDVLPLSYSKSSNTNSRIDRIVLVQRERLKAALKNGSRVLPIINKES